MESEELGRGFGTRGDKGEKGGGGGRAREEERDEGGVEGAYHTRQDEVNASASPVSDAIDGASLT